MARVSDWKADVERSIIASTRAMLGNDVVFDWAHGESRTGRTSFSQPLPEVKPMLFREAHAEAKRGMKEHMEQERHSNERHVIGVAAKCLNCSRTWDITRTNTRKAVHCSDCNGFIVTPSGRVRSRVLWTGEEDVLAKLPKLEG